MGLQRRESPLREDLGGQAQIQPGARRRIGGGRGTHHRRAVQTEHGQCGAGPQIVGHRAGPGEFHPLQHAGIGAEALHRIRGPLPGRGGGQALDRGDPLLIVEGGQHRNQGGEGIGRRPAEDPGVLGPFHGGHRDHRVDRAAQPGSQSGHSHRNVAGVADQQGMGPQLFGVGAHEVLQTAGGLLFRALGHQGHPYAQLVPHGTQGQQVHHKGALAVRRAAPVPASLALGEGEGRRVPGGLVQGGLHVVVAVQQDRRSAVRSRAACDDRVAAVRGLVQVGVVQTGSTAGRGHPFGGAAALRGRELRGVCH
jgi:hypothetical protein